MLCVSCTHEQLATGCSRCLRHWSHGGVNAGGNHGRYISQRLRNDYGCPLPAFDSAVQSRPAPAQILGYPRNDLSPRADWSLRHWYGRYFQLGERDRPLGVVCSGAQHRMKWRVIIMAVRL